MTGDDETTAGADRDIPDVPVSGSGSVEDPPRWMPRLRVRPAVPDDAEELHSLSTASIRRAAASHYSAAELEAWVATRSVAGHRRMLERTAAFVVVDETEDVAGSPRSPSSPPARSSVERWTSCSSAPSTAGVAPRVSCWRPSKPRRGTRASPA